MVDHRPVAEAEVRRCLILRDVYRNGGAVDLIGVHYAIARSTQAGACSHHHRSGGIVGTSREVRKWG